MRVLGIDTETTGLDLSSDRVVELGIVLWDASEHKCIFSKGMYLFEDCYPQVKPDAFASHGISQEILREFGESPKTVYEWLEGFVERHQPRAVVAHNGTAFDKPLLLNEFKRVGASMKSFESLHWIDTLVDLPLPPGSARSLKYMAADHGFLNPFSHRAMFDVLSMMRVLSNYNFDEVYKLSKTPNVLLRALVTREEKDKAKGRGYRWIPEKLWWVKNFKETEVEKEQREAPFKTQIVVL